MKVLKYPDPLLFKRVENVHEFNEELKLQSQEMLTTMKNYGGVGLAANQVGLDKRMFVMQCSVEKPPYIFINPIVVKKSDDITPYEEGCLSFPDLRIELERPAQITISWQDLHGNQNEESFSGLEAVCVQHEIDHLDGIVFVNKLKPTKKQMVLKKYMKTKEKSRE